VASLVAPLLLLLLLSGWLAAPLLLLLLAFLFEFKLSSDLDSILS
jgi:hypothetical protein